MNTKMRSLLNGLVLGLAGKPLEFAKGEPVAYLYNGVRLPDIYKVYTLEVQKTHPFAVLTGSGSVLSPYKVAFYRELFVVHDAYMGEDDWSLLVNGDDYLTTTTKSTDTEWSVLSTNTLAGNLSADNNGIPVQYKMRLCSYASDYVLWSNHSFPGPNGEEWITASDHVPVYE
jgi:hypothetical protein